MITDFKIFENNDISDCQKYQRLLDIVNYNRNTILSKFKKYKKEGNSFNVCEKSQNILFHIISLNDYTLIKYLIDNGIDINNRYKNKNVLYAAINQLFTTHLSDTKIIELLIKSGIDLNTPDDDLMTPLIYMSIFYIDRGEFSDDFDFNKIFNIYKLMFKYGADINIKDINNFTFIDHLKNIVKESDETYYENENILNKLLLVPQIQKAVKIRKFNL
jgi:ankyrin repeat protein